MDKKYRVTVEYLDGQTEIFEGFEYVNCEVGWFRLQKGNIAENTLVQKYLCGQNIRKIDVYPYSKTESITQGWIEA